VLCGGVGVWREEEQLNLHRLIPRLSSDLE